MAAIGGISRGRRRSAATVAAIIRWFGTNTEIEERKRVESELERLTIEATEANRAKSGFLAAMSHELRTPLNAIGGYAQLIEMGVRGPVTDEQRIDLLKIQRSKNHLDATRQRRAELREARFRARSSFASARYTCSRTLDTVIEMIAPQLTQKRLHLAPCALPNDVAVVRRRGQDAADPAQSVRERAQVHATRWHDHASTCA